MDQGSQESLHANEKLPLLRQASPEAVTINEPLVCFSVQ